MDEFAREMQQLSTLAEQTAAARPKPPPTEAGLGAPPVQLGLEAVSRGVTENNRVIHRLSEEIAALAARPAPEPSTDPAPALERMAKAIESLQAQLQRMQAVESANQKLFDSLHEELKQYRDAFLFDVMQKPFVRDLTALADDWDALRRQVRARATSLPSEAASERDFLGKLTANLENTTAHFYEVLVRLEVEPFETKPGDPMDLRRHKTLSVEPAASATENATVARSLRCGFTWRERVLRPEQVVIRRWTPPPAPPPPPLEPIPAAAEASSPDAVPLAPSPVAPHQ